MDVIVAEIYPQNTGIRLFSKVIHFQNSICLKNSLHLKMYILFPSRIYRPFFLTVAQRLDALTKEKKGFIINPIIGVCSTRKPGL